MTVLKTDISEIQSYIISMLGKKTWGVSLGEGSFITMEFGNPILQTKENEQIHGEWHLWVYCCCWRLEQGEHILAASEDSRPKLEKAVQILEGLSLNSVELLAPAWDTIFSFEKQVILRLFSVYSQDYEHWILFAPNGNVITVGPGTNWSLKKSS